MSSTLYFSIVAFIFFIVIAFIVFLLIQKLKFWIRQKRSENEGLNTREIAARWAEIEKLSDMQGDMSLKLAVMEADKLLDYALKSMAMSGATLGERLKFAQYKYDNLRRVWPAHKIRNQIAHEPSFYLDRGTGKRALKDFKDALREIGAL